MASFEKLMIQNDVYVKEYKHSRIMTLLSSDMMQEKVVREQLLNCIQVLSNHFQNLVMLRAVLTNDRALMPIAWQHLMEELGHNIELFRERGSQELIFDPVLESCAAWFTWKIFSLDDIQKVFLIHSILETAAHVFFAKAHEIMRKLHQTSYFKLHSEVDEQHEVMGLSFINDLTEKQYRQLFKIQSEGWGVLNAFFNHATDLIEKAYSDYLLADILEPNSSYMQSISKC